ncbi:MAG: type II toxin-antitoxin system RelE/ParE family toxin [Desulfobulbaceae bacterium]|nr:type II toxin-antitoxin system RelE/ParE family toxin [Desulfobulbaceae bacterium]
MIVEFKKSFVKDLKKHSRDKKLLQRVREIIQEVEDAASLADINNLKKMKAEGFYYRIRSGDYRVGLIIDSETATFVRVLHRSDIYRYFP